MIRNLKVLGMALVAVLAMSAVVASAASATAFNFQAARTPVKLTGKQHGENQDVFTTDVGSIGCTEVSYEGEQTVSPSASVSVVPSFGGCAAFGFANVPIDVNGCTYRFNAVTKEGANFEGSVDIVCGGNPITVTAPGCTVTIGSQNGLNKVTYTHVGVAETREVTVDVAIEGIKYEEHNKGIFPTCAANTVPKNNGKYIGAALVTGERPGTNEHVGVFVE